jgi:hypothetical protein
MFHTEHFGQPSFQIPTARAHVRQTPPVKDVIDALKKTFPIPDVWTTHMKRFREGRRTAEDGKSLDIVYSLKISHVLPQDLFGQPPTVGTITTTPRKSSE